MCIRDSRQPCVLLRGIGVPKPVEGQTAVRALVADLVAMTIDKQLQEMCIRDRSELVSLLRSSGEAVRAVLESTGSYHCPVVAALLENGIFVSVVKDVYKRQAAV